MGGHGTCAIGRLGEDGQKGKDACGHVRACPWTVRTKREGEQNEKENRMRRRTKREGEQNEKCPWRS